MSFIQQRNCQQISSTKHFPHLLFSLKPHFIKSPQLKTRLSYILGSIGTHLRSLLWWALFPLKIGGKFQIPSSYSSDCIAWIPKSLILCFKTVINIMKSLICKRWLFLVKPNKNVSYSKFCSFCSWMKMWSWTKTAKPVWDREWFDHQYVKFGRRLN